MERLILAIAISLGLMGAGPGQQSATAAQPNLESVLKKMDAVAATFRSAQANFQWQTYEKVIDEIDDVKTGNIYYRKTGNGIEMMAEVKQVGSSPTTLKNQAEYVLVSGGMVRMYQPKIDTVTQ